MKVLICHRPGGAFGYISDGWINALKSVNIDVSRWDGNPKTWRSYSPDLYIGCSGHKQPIPDKRSCKVAIHVNPHGPVKVKPGVNERVETIGWVKSRKPDVVFGYGFEKDRHLWSYWDRDGIPWIPMACAGDATIYKPSNGDHKKFDVAYIGGRWKYKAEVIDTYLLPVLRDRSLSVAVFGWGEWPFVVERASDTQVASVLANTKVGPCISEPHTLNYGIDIPERVFKVSLSGALPVHDPVPGLGKLIPHLPVMNNPREYHLRITSAIKSDSLGESAVGCYNDVFGAHTYHHRLAHLFKSLGFNKEAKLLLGALEDLKVDFSGS